MALEAALDLKTRGLYAINPQVGAGVLRSADRLRNSDRGTVRSSAQRFEAILKRYPWIDDAVQRAFVSSSCRPSLRKCALRSRRIIPGMLIVLGPNDLSPFRRLPVVGSLVGRRLLSSEHIRVEIVPGLDHDFLSTLGRARAIDIIDRHVVETYSGAI